MQGMLGCPPFVWVGGCLFSRQTQHPPFICAGGLDWMHGYNRVWNILARVGQCALYLIYRMDVALCPFPHFRMEKGIMDFSLILMVLGLLASLFGVWMFADLLWIRACKWKCSREEAFKESAYQLILGIVMFVLGVLLKRAHLIFLQRL